MTHLTHSRTVTSQLVHTSYTLGADRRNTQSALVLVGEHDAELLTNSSTAGGEEWAKEYERAYRNLYNALRKYEAAYGNDRADIWISRIDQPSKYNIREWWRANRRPLWAHAETQPVILHYTYYDTPMAVAVELDGTWNEWMYNYPAALIPIPDGPIGLDDLWGDLRDDALADYGWTIDNLYTEILERMDLEDTNINRLAIDLMYIEPTGWDTLKYWGERPFCDGDPHAEYGTTLGGIFYGPAVIACGRVYTLQEAHPGVEWKEWGLTDEETLADLLQQRIDSLLLAANVNMGSADLKALAAATLTASPLAATDAMQTFGSRITYIPQDIREIAHWSCIWAESYRALAGRLHGQGATA